MRDSPTSRRNPSAAVSPTERSSGQPAPSWTSCWDEALWPKSWNSQAWDSTGSSNWIRSTKSSQVSTGGDAGKVCRGDGVGVGRQD